MPLLGRYPTLLEVLRWYALTGQIPNALEVFALVCPYLGKEEKVKEKIHPKYQDCVIVCACGNTIHTRSTKPNIRVEVCSKCHPFFSGQQKFVDSAGRVDKFMKKYGKKSAS